MCHLLFKCLCKLVCFQVILLVKTVLCCFSEHILTAVLYAPWGAVALQRPWIVQAKYGICDSSGKENEWKVIVIKCDSLFKAGMILGKWKTTQGSRQ